VAAASLVAGGCSYKRPDIEANFNKIQADMTEAQVIGLLGEPTKIESGEMYYIYDDPRSTMRPSANWPRPMR
jgi:hypothetical protein